MEKILKQILDEIQVLKEGQDALRTEIKDFRESQDVTNRLITSDMEQIKQVMREVVHEELKPIKQQLDRIEQHQSKGMNIEDLLRLGSGISKERASEWAKDIEEARNDW
jgi:septation ring formation regulator EzrA